MAEIRVEHLQKRFGEFAAVRGPSFTVPDGHYFCLLGPTGCGKTTTLRMIAGLEVPTAGRICLHGTDVTFRPASQRELMCGELRALHDRLKATTVYVTHDQMEAMSMADTIALMNQGVIEQMGPPQEIYDRPVSMFVADFVGSPPMSFLPFRGRL